MTIEAPARLDPCLPTALEPEIVDLIAALSSADERLGNRLHPLTAASLADHVRVMNCYYSTLIEGHNTRPPDIKAALQDHYDGHPERRNLQQEDLAHIRVQVPFLKKFRCLLWFLKYLCRKCNLLIKNNTKAFLLNT